MTDMDKLNRKAQTKALQRYIAESLDGALREEGRKLACTMAKKAIPILQKHVRALLEEQMPKIAKELTSKALKNMSIYYDD